MIHSPRVFGGFRASLDSSGTPERRGGGRAPRGVACVLNHFDYPRVPSIKTSRDNYPSGPGVPERNEYEPLFNYAIQFNSLWIHRGSPPYAARCARYCTYLSIAHC